MRHFVMVAIAAAALIVAAASAQADVIFDPATGTGSVGKGDIQSRFGEDAVTPEGAEQVWYQMAQRSVYRTTCRERGTTNKQVFDQTFTTWTEVDADVVLNPQDKVTSFDLTGFGASSTKGRYCPRGWRRSGAPELYATGTPRLFANFDEQRARIWVAAE